MHKLSIITVNLNNANGLRKTIQSVINQTSDNFEYLVIDGGSNDGSVDVIKQYADRIAYWVSEKDKGIYNAMNKGIRHATGDYCQFINSGDYLVNETVIERMIAALPDCSILYGNMLKLLPNRKIYRDRGPAGRPVTFLTFYRGTLNHSPAYIKRSLFKKFGYYDESLKIVSDWKFYLIAVGLNNEPVAYRDVDVTIFDMNGISNINNKIEKFERRKVLESLIPTNILKDYDNNWFLIEQITRINKYKPLYSIFYFIERIIARLERFCKKGKYYHF